jgi:phosphate/sulfate permease
MSLEPIITILSILSAALLSINNSITFISLLKYLGLKTDHVIYMIALSNIIGIILFSNMITPPTTCSTNDQSSAYPELISLFTGLIISILIATFTGTSLSATMALVFSTAGIYMISGRPISEWIIRVFETWIILGALSIILTIILRIFIIKVLNLQKRDLTKTLFLYKIFSPTTYLTISVLLAGNNIGFLSSMTCHQNLLYMIFSPASLLILLARPDKYKNIYEKILMTISRHYSITLSTLVMLIIANTIGVPISYTFIITLSYATTVLTGASLGARKIIRRIMINWIYSISIAFIISLSVFFMLRIF